MAAKMKYDDSWNFKGYSMKEGVHGMHPYPAMLMPKIAERIFNILSVKKDSNFYDPFCGSGTTLVEAQKYGIKNLYGTDLNPLALLISKVKLSPIDLRKLELEITRFDKFLLSKNKKR